VNPDGFASEFGRHVRNDDFEQGLRWLLQDDRWRARGEAAARYVTETFETDRTIECHLATYRELLDGRPGPAVSFSL
jgi:hypothetical protein